jgi:hypothetical protein
VSAIQSAIITALGAVLVGYLTYLASRRNGRADSAQKMIDQHQEDIKELRQETADLRRTQRIQGDYIGELRRHIVDNKPPPPPPYPSGLIT